MVLEKSIHDVHTFWNAAACGTHFIDAGGRSREFYDRFREFRYRTEWHIPELVPFTEMGGKEVLEIGCGNGADGVLFASNGARYTGVDLTEEAVGATAEHFRHLGLEGRFQVENAERLSFPDGSFDTVYSHGVLHHMPEPQRGIEEVFRVLRPGGRAVIMLYHRRSFNYVVRIMGYMRLRVAATALLRIGRWKRDRERFAALPPDLHQGNHDSRIWEIHYRALLAEGWGYLRASRFVHHATDGPACPFAYAYSRRDVARLFSRFTDISTRVAHFPLAKYRLTSWVPRTVERRLGRLFGWYLFIYATRPAEAGRGGACAE